MNYEVSERDCKLCNTMTKHFRAGEGPWACINLDKHDPLHPKSDNWMLLRTMLEDVEKLANQYLDERNAAIATLAALRTEP